MFTRGTQTITWDVENRPVSVTSGNVTSTFVYDGDGNRVKKTEGGQTILYINGCYEKNLATGNVTTYYYLGGRLVAMRQSVTLTYVHQDHLTGTSVVSDSSGNLTSSIKYYAFGECRNSQGNPGTDKLFTGQRLDGTGLYYYGARYYDASIGRFVSADTIVQSPGNPQTLNRYSYCLNNPLAYTDSTGNWVIIENEDAALEWSYLNWGISKNGVGMCLGLEVPSWVTGWAYLRCAWDMLRKTGSGLARELEAPGHWYEIRWDPTIEVLGDITIKDIHDPRANIAIRLNPNRDIWGDMWETFMVFVEEAFHASYHLNNGYAPATKDEEIVAKSCAFWHGYALGYSSKDYGIYSFVRPYDWARNSNQFSNLEVFRADILKAVPALVDQSKLYYGRLPMANDKWLAALQDFAYLCWPYFDIR
jgi:RHS repeat-associated protein